MQSVHTRLKYKWSLETRARQQKQESFRFKSDESYYSSDKSGGAAPRGRIHEGFYRVESIRQIQMRVFTV